MNIGIMEAYLKNYESYKKKAVYNFQINNGCLADCIKFFMYALGICIKHDIRLYYQINNIPIEKYIRLKYENMYIQPSAMRRTANLNTNTIHTIVDDEDLYYIVTPFGFYSIFNYDTIENVGALFDFSDAVKLNAERLIPELRSPYTSIHLRLGDKFLEQDTSFIRQNLDQRVYDEGKICHTIEQNSDKSCVFFCDNNGYRRKIASKYKNLLIPNSAIGYTGFATTSDKQVLDTITEFYLLVHSEKIYAASESGFSIVAARFRNIPLISLNT